MGHGNGRDRRRPTRKQQDEAENQQKMADQIESIIALDRARGAVGAGSSNDISDVSEGRRAGISITEARALTDRLSPVDGNYPGAVLIEAAAALRTHIDSSGHGLVREQNPDPVYETIWEYAAEIDQSDATPANVALEVTPAANSRVILTEIYSQADNYAAARTSAYFTRDAGDQRDFSEFLNVTGIDNETLLWPLITNTEGTIVKNSGQQTLQLNEGIKSRLRRLLLAQSEDFALALRGYILGGTTAPTVLWTNSEIADPSADVTTTINRTTTRLV